MNLETRLKALECHAYGGRMSPGVSLIFPTESGWRLLFSLWNAATGNGVKTIESIHDSEAAAIEEYDRLLTRYHTKEASIIILDV